MSKNGFSRVRINRLVKTCAAPHDASDDNRYRVTPEDVYQLLDTSESTITGFARKSLFPPKEKHNGVYFYDLRDLLKTIWKNWRESGESAISTQIEEQKLEKLRLENEETRGELISKKAAKERHLSLLSALSNMLNYAIKNVTPQTIGCNDLQKQEMILREGFKAAFRLLKEQAEAKEWEAEE